jgi:hypothetical protein
MNFDKAERLLDKMNRLFTSMKIDQSEVSSIERDLMRNYIQQFYEEFVGGDSPASSRKRVISPKPPQDSSYQPPRPDSSPGSSLLQEKPKPRPVVEEKKPEPKPVVEEKKSEPRPRPVVDVPKEEPKPVKKEEIKEATEVPPQPEPPKPEKRRPVTPPSKGDEDPEYDLLFAQEQAKELADRLGESPIEDLTRAFSINDRIFNINELFGGDQDAFMDTLRHLNSLHTFEDAKDYLASEVAGKYDWTQKGKKSIAKSFIKTVRRRFKNMG